jgi:hypothetical protein
MVWRGLRSVVLPARRAGQFIRDAFRDAALTASPLVPGMSCDASEPEETRR